VSRSNLALVEDGPVREDLLADDFGVEISREELGRMVLKHVRQLDHWAEANADAAWWDRVIFWTTKLLVLAGAGGTSAFAIFDMNQFATGAALASTVLTTMEAIRPRGALYRVHMKAANDLRILQTWVLTRWDQIRLAYPGADGKHKRAEELVVLFDELIKRRRQIGDTLGGAEANLGNGAGFGAK
jgi:hypothetical protein